MRGDYNSREIKGMRLTSYVIWINVFYHTIKVLVPVFALTTCTFEDEHHCRKLSDKCVHILLMIDITYHTNLLIYMIYSCSTLGYFSWKYSRLEAKQHMSFIVINSLGMVSGQTLIVGNLIIFFLHPDFYLGWRLGYYFDWLAQLWPALIYLLTKKNEDCFACFNRLAPQVYSIYQFSTAEIKEADLSFELREPRKNKRFSGLLINLTESQCSRFGSFKRGNATDSFRSSIRLLNCPHGKIRNCEECADRIENNLNAQLVRENDIRVESYDTSTPEISQLTVSEFKASSLNEDKTMTGSAPDKSTIEKSAVTHREGS